MNRTKSWCVALSGLLLLVLFPGCPAQGVGDPCVPEDEYSPTFSGYAVSEVSTEASSFQCQTRLCLVNHFQGRVSCPYGQSTEATGACELPGSDDPVLSVVKPQLLDRRTNDAVYGSCTRGGRWSIWKFTARQPTTRAAPAPRPPPAPALARPCPIPAAA